MVRRLPHSVEEQVADNFVTAVCAVIDVYSGTRHIEEYVVSHCVVC